VSSSRLLFHPVTFLGTSRRSLVSGALSELRFYSTATPSSTKQGVPNDTGELKNTMASDEDYGSFLDKANQDPNEGHAQTTSNKVELKAVDSGVEIPKVLKEATKDAWYTSDADEKFTPVVLKFKGKTLPDEGMFAFPPPSFVHLYFNLSIDADGEQGLSPKQQVIRHQKMRRFRSLMLVSGMRRVNIRMWLRL
jgi:hypothetical protein